MLKLCYADLWHFLWQVPRPVPQCQAVSTLGAEVLVQRSLYMAVCGEL